MIRRRTLAAIPMALAGVTGAGVAQAQTFPNGPIRIVVTSPPGGSADLISRVLGDKVGAELHQSVVIENRPGGGTAIGSLYAARSRPDGQTLLLIQAFGVIGTLLQENPGYSLDRDFTPIIGVGAFPLVIAVRGASDLRSLADVARVARAQEGGIVYASGGIGSLGHLSSADLLNQLGVPGTHVPYRGNADGVQALLAGQVQLMFATTSDVAQLARSGQIRLLGIASGERMATLPDVPTTRELGYPDMTPRTWFGYSVPAGTPAASVDRLRASFGQAIADPGVQERLSALGFRVEIMSGAEFGRFMQSEAERWGRVIRRNNITLR